jgi:predicted RNA-binding Zn-ribbon protein involved in translation (DUF1610 family)
MECNACTTGSWFCGQAFTSRECTSCHKMINWHNTAVPKLCHACGVKNNSCTQCGKKLEEAVK